MDPTLSCGLLYLSFGIADMIGIDGHVSFLPQKKKFGETHANASGQRLIQLLHGTGMYALNGRAPCAQPAWTRCRMSRSEQSILDYILADADCFSTAPAMRVSRADLSDHY